MKKEIPKGVNCQNLIINKGTYINHIAHIENYYESNRLDPLDEDKNKGRHETPKDALVSELLPIFKNDEVRVRSFLDLVANAAPKSVTTSVKEYVAKGWIYETLKNKDLWEILHRNGLYKPTLTNWNTMVK